MISKKLTKRAKNQRPNNLTTEPPAEEGLITEASIKDNDQDDIGKRQWKPILEKTMKVTQCLKKLHKTILSEISSNRPSKTVNTISNQQERETTHICM